VARPRLPIPLPPVTTRKWATARIRPLTSPQPRQAVVVAPAQLRLEVVLPLVAEAVDAVAMVVVVADVAADAAVAEPRRTLLLRHPKARWQRPWEQPRPWDTYGRPKSRGTRCATP